MTLNTYINNLIENINENNLPGEIDLVLGSVAFNRVFMMGV